MLLHSVIIVGAGLAGLESESRNRVGGRTWNKKLPDELHHPDLAVDGGAQFIGPLHSNVLSKCKEYELDIIPINTKGKIILSIDKTRTLYEGKIPSVGIFGIIDLGFKINKITKLANIINIQEPWKSPNASYLDSISVFHWIEKESHSKKTKGLISIVIKAVFGCESYEISMLYFLFYIKSNQSIEYLTEVSNGAQESFIKGGTQQISQKMADSMQNKILLDHNVNIIEYNDNKVLVKCENGKQFESQFIIIAIPPPIINRIKMIPPLPYKRYQLNSRMFMTPMIKFQIYYKTSFWKDMDLEGTINCDCKKKEYIVTDTMDYCQIINGNEVPCIVGFMGGNDAVSVIDLSKEERLNIIVKQFEELFQSKLALTPLHYEETCWLQDSIQYGTLAVMGPNVMTNFGQSLRKPIGRIHWAGTETAVHFNGYMDGALESGNRAGLEVIDKLNK